MPRTHQVQRGTFQPDGLCHLTDAQYHSKVDTSPPIRDAYKTLGRISNPSARMCDSLRVWGQANSIRAVSGAPKGDAPACGTVGKHWRTSR